MFFPFLAYYSLLLVINAGVVPAAQPSPIVATAEMPGAVRAAIAAADRIAGRPYKFGGGHENFEDDGYDCSGSTSYVLHAAGVLEAALPSVNFLDFGEEGPGRWITIYARSGHVFLVIDGKRFDTTDGENIGPGWREETRPPESFVARHPKGL